jgi:hypothetical protein
MAKDKPKTTARDFFLWLGAMVSLYVSAVSLIALVFQYINYAFPDELQYYVDPYSGTIRFAIASLIVLFPMFLYLMKHINRDMEKHPEKKDIWIRRWLIYITLFVAGATLAGDLITLINYFLGGDITTRFVLKVVTVFVVIGAIFVYQLYSLRDYWSEHTAKARALGIGAGVAVLATIVGGFFIIGSPQYQRDLRMDQERLRDLQRIQGQVVDYWRETERLPENLEALEDPIVGFTAPTDPETNDPYEYSTTGELTFELCATFEQPSNEQIRQPQIVAPGMTAGDENWSHDAGRTCFERTIDPERVRPFDNNRPPTPKPTPEPTQ